MVTRFFKALMAGKSLTNVAAWKNAQTAVNSVTVVLTFVLYLVRDKFEMTEEDIKLFAGVVVTLVGLFNTYLINATSEKVGIPQGGNE